MNYVDIEDDESDQVKKFLKKYGNMILTLILIIILGIVGLQYWHKRQAKNAMEASITYENLLGSLAAKQQPQVQAFANQLMQDFSGTPYAKMAALITAKQAVQANKLSLAINKLQWVVEHASTASIKAIAQIRLAEVLIADNKAKQAIEAVSNVKPAAFLAQANMLKGDAYSALKQTAQAKQAYTTALKQAEPSSSLYAYIQMKLYSL